MSTRILILGANGMLGHKLLLELSKMQHYEVFGTVRRMEPALRRLLKDGYSNMVYENIDAQDFDAVCKVIVMVAPQIIINCVGVIKQSEMARDPLTCIYTNAVFPHRLNIICRLGGIRMIHVSTDCVFDGREGDYREMDPPCPVDLYGRSKLLGEVEDAPCLTLRTSIIGHELRGRYGLIEWFLSQTVPVNGFVHHIYSGVPTIVLARMLAQYLLPRADLHGVYQLSSQPISKYDLLRLVARDYHHPVEIYPDENSRCNRSMNSDLLKQAIGFEVPSWEEMVRQMYEDYCLTGYKNMEQIREG